MKKLYEKIGESTLDNLVIDNVPPADVCVVIVKTGEGILYRGSVLKKDTDGNAIHLSSAISDDNGLYILADTVDASSGDVTAFAYRSGHFNKNALITKNSYELSSNDIEALRRNGIIISSAIAYEEKGAK